MKLGDTLKQAREAKELTIQAVADAIHLSVKQIHALETNNFSLLPEPVTTRGFIRSYARFLEIDSEPLLVNYREQVPHQDPNTIVMSGQVNKVISEKEHTPWLMYILGSIVVLLLLVVWFYYMDNVNDWTVESADDIVLETPLEENPELSLAATPSELPVEEQPEAIQTEVNSEPDSDTESVVVPESTVTNKDTSLPKTPPKELLVLRLAEACWVSIKTGHGEKFFEQLLPAATEQSFDIKPPFKLKIGNATAAMATYRGQALDLSDYTRGSVARLTVTDEMLTQLNQTATDMIDTNATNPLDAKELASSINPSTALIIKTQEASWISVKDASGNKVFEQLLPPASNETIVVAKPFRLTVGNASAVQASYNNEPLDLDSNKQHNVARLNIK